VGEGQEGDGALTKEEILSRIDRLLVLCNQATEPEMLVNDATDIDDRAVRAESRADHGAT
jgi:hypothetical protein